MNQYRGDYIRLGKVLDSKEFTADSDHAAWSQAHEGVDPLTGAWVCVTRIDEDAS